MYVATLPAVVSAPRVDAIRVSPSSPVSDQDARIEVRGSDFGPPRTGKLTLRDASGERWVEVHGSDPEVAGYRLIWHADGPVELILEPSFLRRRPEGRHELRLLVENVDGVSCWQPLTLNLEHAEIRCFRQPELEDRGVALEPGGGWDRRLEGAVSPCGIRRTPAGYVMFYIGAAGDRADGGPRHRQLGFAVSDDGLCFRKWLSPVLSPTSAYGSGLDGILSAAVLADGEEVETLYAVLQARGPDGADHRTDIWRGATRDLRTWQQRRVIEGDGAKLRAAGRDFLPVAAIARGRRRFVFAIAESGSPSWRLWLIELRGDVLVRMYEVPDLGPQPVLGMTDPVRLSGQRYGFLLTRGPRQGPWILEMRTSPVDRPAELSPAADALAAGDRFRHAAVLLDRDLAGRSRWLLYLEEVRGGRSRYRVLSAAVFGA
ncbi:MAG: hypothetical protein V3T72_05565 [Thermoanaerobaculia bacterium]